MIKKYLAFAVLSAIAASSFAAVGISADVGTTGVGAHVTVPISPTLDTRFGVNYFSYDYNGNTSDAKYKFDLQLNTWDFLMDYHPLRNGLRLTGGLIYNNNKIDAHATANGNGTYTFNGNTYSASTAGNVDGTVSFNKLAPYVGIGYGYGSADRPGLGVSVDLGVMYQGSASTSMSSSGCSASAATCSQLASDVATENTKLNDKVKNYQYYPVIRVGVNYHF